MHQVTGKPIKFVTVGERPIDLEAFHPDRMASRILGMGDVVSLVEKAAEQFEADEAKKLEERLRQNTFGFDDFLSQISKIRKMGGIMSLLKFIPGMSELPMDEIDDKAFNRIEGIINSMTPKERRDPEIISNSRRQRIAKGSGVQLQEINQLLKQFNQMRAVMAKMGNGGLGGLGGLFGGGGGMGGLGGLFGGGAPAAPSMPANPYGGGMYGGYGMRPHGSSSGVSRSQNAGLLQRCQPFPKRRQQEKGQTSPQTRPQKALRSLKPKA